jgi:nicotinate phosphoribosyltransferase
MLFEVPILAIVNEVSLESIPVSISFFEKGSARLKRKIEIARNGQFNFADFGTRRRFSRSWQERVVWTLANAEGINFVGTSNVYLAMKYKVKAIGTQAHEWIMGFQGMNCRLEDSQKRALQVWADEYRGDLGIALSDTVGFNAFLNDFDKYFAKLYDGVRHDSGDPVEWGEKMISKYKDYGIDPMTKQLVFSDGLDFEEAYRIDDVFIGRINVSFGIGTNLTNDFEGVLPLQIVIKMTKCNGRPVAKISDAPGKTMCKDEEFLRNIKNTFGVR